jgi:hypothetical protein
MSLISGPSSGHTVAAALAFTAAVAGLWFLNSVHTFTKPQFSIKTLPKGSKYLVKGYRGQYRDAKKYAEGLPKSVASSWVALYWDDPRIMHDRCRFSVGVPSAGLSSETRQTLLSQGFVECHVDEDIETLYCAFPYTGKISGIVAAIRVYPAWVDAAKELGKGHGPIVKITPNESEGFTEFYFMTMPPKEGSSFAKCMSSVS